MPIPRSRNARLFYRAAKERLEDAELLLSLNRTTGAVYLAGYSVECMIKSLILSAVSPSREEAILASFRGGQAHDYSWLIDLYYECRGTAIPNRLFQHFTRVERWSTNLRYSPQTIQQRQAKAFLDSTSKIMKWADGRL